MESQMDDIRDCIDDMANQYIRENLKKTEREFLQLTISIDLKIVREQS